jgi:hypothetical protein
MRRLLAAAVALSFAALASTAGASTPQRRHQVFAATVVVTDICPFPVTIDFSADWAITDFTGTDGTLVRTHLAGSETDVFSANGRSLTGETYHYSYQVLFAPDGTVTHNYAAGIVEKVRLPDGSLFISAGRLDFAAHPGLVFAITPDVGRSGNVAGLCAALAP